MKVFSGSSNPSLAKKITQELKVELGRIELSRFSNGEARVWIKEKVVNDAVVVVQSFSPEPDKQLVEYLLIVDALKRKGVKKIISIIPWLGYCIQDKVFRSGEPLSSKVVAKLIQTAKVDRIITLDLHNQTIAGFFDIPFVHLSANQAFFDYFKSNKNNFDLLVSPDIGGYKRTLLFSKKLKLPILTVVKERDLKSGRVTILDIKGNDKEEIRGLIKGKKILIVDDFISTGGTLIETADYLKNRGAKKVSACLTHHFYIPGVQEKIEKSDLDELFATDTIQAPDKVKYKKLRIISVAKLISESIKFTVR